MEASFKTSSQSFVVSFVGISTDVVPVLPDAKGRTRILGISIIATSKIPPTITIGFNFFNRFASPKIILHSIYMGLDELLYQSINRFYYFLDEYSKKLGLTGDVLLCMKMMGKVEIYLIMTALRGSHYRVGEVLFLHL